MVSAEVVSVARGASALLTQPDRIERLSIGDPEIADAVAVSPYEVLVNTRALGTTTLIVWLTSGQRRLYTVEVTADADALSRQLNLLFPGESIQVRSTRNLLILSGQVHGAGVAERALEVAEATGAQVISNLEVPPARQVLLQVRFAEVTRRAAERAGVGLQGSTVAGLLGPGVPREGESALETLSDGLVRLFLFEDGVQVNAVIEALRERGIFKSLAEPNLLALEGEEASFLAGGEFPYPVPQGGQNNNTVTIAFKEFGVRLRFRPTITLAGHIRLDVMPEVSSLDFANGLRYSGFNIPSLLTRRAETSVELRPGQTFAIAGLMDNLLQNTTGRIPLLGDLPILGALFRSKDAEQRRTELLVLVTPTIVGPMDMAPPVPTGEPEGWDWERSLRGSSQEEIGASVSQPAAPGLPQEVQAEKHSPDPKPTKAEAGLLGVPLEGAVDGSISPALR